MNEGTKLSFLCNDILEGAHETLSYNNIICCIVEKLQDEGVSEHWLAIRRIRQMAAHEVFSFANKLESVPPEVDLFRRYSIEIDAYLGRRNNGDRSNLASIVRGAFIFAGESLSVAIRQAYSGEVPADDAFKLLGVACEDEDKEGRAIYSMLHALRPDTFGEATAVCMMISSSGPSAKMLPYIPNGVHVEDIKLRALSIIQEF